MIDDDNAPAIDAVIAASIRRHSTLTKSTTSLTQRRGSIDDDCEEEFFKTAVTIDDGNKDSSLKAASSSLEIRLPVTVNTVALRETLFSEAPFVTRQNKAFWRRMVDSKPYSNILAAAYNFVAPCIAENGAVNADKLNEVKSSWLIGFMATNISDMIYSYRRLDRDIFFNRLPELVTFMVVTALHTSIPKHHRVYNSVRFREIILDWCTELIWGIRISNCHHNREWLFADASDSNIMVTYANTNTLLQKNKTGPLSGASSCYSIEHTPLVQMYIDMNNNSNTSTSFTQSQSQGKGGHEGTRTKSLQALKITMSHQADRPLMTLSAENLIKVGRPREKHIDMESVRRGMKSSKVTLQRTKEEAGALKVTNRQELREIRSQYRDKLSEMKSSLDSSIHKIRKELQTTRSIDRLQLAAADSALFASSGAHEGGGGTAMRAKSVSTGTGTGDGAGTLGAMPSGGAGGGTAAGGGIAAVINLNDRGGGGGGGGGGEKIRSGTNSARVPSSDLPTLPSLTIS